MSKLTGTGRWRSSIARARRRAAEAERAVRVEPADSGVLANDPWNRDAQPAAAAERKAAGAQRALRRLARHQIFGEGRHAADGGGIRTHNETGRRKGCAQFVRPRGREGRGVMENFTQSFTWSQLGTSRAWCSASSGLASASGSSAAPTCRRCTKRSRTSRTRSPRRSTTSRSRWRASIRRQGACGERGAADGAINKLTERIDRWLERHP